MSSSSVSGEIKTSSNSNPNPNDNEKILSDALVDSKLHLEDKETKKQIHNETKEEEKDLLTRYNDLLDTNPVLTKAITASFISGFGTILGSYLSKHSKNKKNNNNNPSGFPWLDVFVFSLHGGLIGGPVGHYW